MCYDKCCQECFNHHYCFLSLSIPCYILSFLSSPFPFHASSFHSFPHLVGGQRCVSPVPDTSVLHLFRPFLTFPFHASSFHSFPHLVEGQRCVSPVPEISVPHLSFLSSPSFPCFTFFFLSSPSFPHLPFHSTSYHSFPAFPFPGETSSSEILVVVCFGMVSDLADLRTKAVPVTAASSGLIHVTGGLCLSSSSFEMHPSRR